VTEGGVTSETRLFGVRHHGPGCAKSLAAALEAWKPDCLLVEGPPEADGLVAHVRDAAMEPPVAILAYCPDEPQLAAFYPFASFSPEWQALRWSALAGVPTRFMDLPRANDLALSKQTGKDDEQEDEEADADEEKAARGARAEPRPSDPLDWLARASGHADGESFWNHLVEERGDATDLFSAIAEAMTTLRAEWERDRPPGPETARERREALREAHMRQTLRAARKEGFMRIAVVCGAWHLAGIAAVDAPSSPKSPNSPKGGPTAKADAALLKGLPKIKIAATWVPWTHHHLTFASGYGAGVRSPGWYDFLFRHDPTVAPRSVGWLARVAGLLRARDLDVSSAHVIEAARLADALAALQDRPAPGLDDLNEATRSVMLMGEDAPLRLIERGLTVGDVLGHVPTSVPTVPLQRDVEQRQKSLRLKPEATRKVVDLDLRQPNDLARSHLLHRLALLDVTWGEVSAVGHSGRGSFHEVWELQWQPTFAVTIIEASRWGGTLEVAATTCVLDRAAKADKLEELAQLVDAAMLGDLGDAIPGITRTLANRAAVTGDALSLLRAIPPLANVFRYGSVRQVDTSVVAHVVDTLIVRASTGLSLACAALDETAAEVLRGSILATHAAVSLRNADEPLAAWRSALRQLGAAETSAPLLRGLATRLLFDAGEQTAEDTGVALRRSLSSGNDASVAAAWLEGFLNRNALVLLHDDQVWSLVDGWLASLGDDPFTRVLPIVRRSFSAFAASDRRSLGERARSTDGGLVTLVKAPAAPSMDADRAALALPLLKQILGVP
jgi:hypothetical protein